MTTEPKPNQGRISPHSPTENHEQTTSTNLKSTKSDQKHQKKLAKNDQLAAQDLLQDFFNDFYTHRGRIYRVNFFRGVWFGLGTFLGGTIIVAVVIFILSWLIQIPGGLGDFFRWIMDTLQKR